MRDTSLRSGLHRFIRAVKYRAWGPHGGRRHVSALQSLARTSDRYPHFDWCHPPTIGLFAYHWVMHCFHAERHTRRTGGAADTGEGCVSSCDASYPCELMAHRFIVPHTVACRRTRIYKALWKVDMVRTWSAHLREESTLLSIVGHLKA